MRKGWDCPSGVAQDSTFVYWADVGVGAVLRAPIAGGLATTLAAGQSSIPELTLADCYLYWVQSDNGPVLRMRAEGGTPETIVKSLVGGANVAVGRGQAYATGLPPGFRGDSDGVVVRVPLDGGTISTLATHQFLPGPVAVAGGSLYWWDDAPDGGGNLMEMPLGGGWPTTVAIGVSSNFTVNSTTLFAATATGIEAFPLDGGTPTVLMTGSFGAMIADDGALYALGPAAARPDIVKMTLADGGTEVLGSSPGGTSFMGLGPDSLCWTSCFDHPDGTRAEASVECVQPR